VRLGETVVPTPLPAWSQRCRPDERDGVVNVLLCGASTELPRLAVEEAAISAGVEIRLVDTRTDPLEKVAKLRRRAHVVVDAAASGPWVESLAGLATGAVVLNTLAGQSQALRELRYYGGSDPFEHFNARRLVPILRGVLETGIASLLERGAANRQWIQTRWEFAEQWQRWWLPPIAAAVRRHRWEMTDG
jgi:hypothetical protein